MSRSRNRADLAARLRNLADAVEHGRHPVPVLGLGVRMVAGHPVVPPVVHDLLCGWRVKVRAHTDPPVNACVGCGLAVPDPHRNQETP